MRIVINVFAVGIGRAAATCHLEGTCLLEEGTFPLAAGSARPLVPSYQAGHPSASCLAGLQAPSCPASCLATVLANLAKASSYQVVGRTSTSEGQVGYP